MKVPASVRALHAVQLERNLQLRHAVESLLEPQLRLHPLWHYEGRTKTEESFALKIESGRFPDPAHLEDFFACTIVVRNYIEIEVAEALLVDLFSVQERRPRSNMTSNKRLMARSCG